MQLEQYLKYSLEERKAITKEVTTQVRMYANENRIDTAKTWDCKGKKLIIDIYKYLQYGVYKNLKRFKPISKYIHSKAKKILKATEISLSQMNELIRVYKWSIEEINAYYTVRF